MKYLQIELQLDDNTIHPMHDFVVENDEYSPTLLLHWNLSNKELSTMVFYVEGDIDKYERALRSISSIKHYSIPFDGGESYIYIWQQLGESDKRIVDAFTQTGMVVLSPIKYCTDRTMCIDLIGTSEALQEAIDLIPDSVSVNVLDIGGNGARPMHPKSQLTDRQMEAVATAVEIGYYRTPREATIEDVSNILGCTTGTTAEHLRKAESKVMNELTDDNISRSGWTINKCTYNQR